MLVRQEEPPACWQHLLQPSWALQTVKTLVINLVVSRNLRHRPLRTVLTVLAIGIEVALILLIWGLAEGLVGESNRRKRGVGADILIRASTSTATTGLGRADLTGELIETIEALPEVAVVVGTTVQMQSDSNTVTGVNLERFGRMSGGLRYVSGGPFEGPYDVLVDESYARQKKLAVGDTVRVMNRDFRLTGITETGKLSRIFVPLGTMQELMSLDGKLSQIYVKLHDPEQAQSMVVKLQKMLPKHPVYSMEEFITLFTAQTKAMGSEFIAVIVGIAISAGFIVVLLAMYTAVLDRTREVGILKALGGSPSYILQIFLRESIGMTVCGIVVGIAVAFGARAFVHNNFPLVVIQFLPSHIIWASVISLIGSTLGTIYPAIRAARQDAIEALAYE